MSQIESRMKILIVGIGGVGGYFGGLLAEEYARSNQVDVYFLARGAHLDAIRNKGLTIIENGKESIVYPKLATNNSEEIGEVDVVLMATKTYDLEAACLQVKPCLKEDTILLPLLNGVNNTEVINQMFPNNTVLNGCVYIISRLSNPGVITNSGNIQALYFGTINSENEKLKELEKVFTKANIHATLSADILSVIWEKYIFLSAIAAATSHFDCTIGSLLNNKQKERTLKKLVHEVALLAKTKKIVLSNNIEEKTLKKFKSLPEHITSSLHSDFQIGKEKTEVDTLIGYVVNEGRKLSVSVPVFGLVYKSLKSE